MKLTPAHIEQFRRRGYVAVPGFFNAQEVAALQADIARLKRNSFLRNVARAGDGTTPTNEKVNLQLCPANFYSTLIRALPFAPGSSTSSLQGLERDLFTATSVTAPSGAVIR